MKGIIYNIQRFSVHDGPGIRTTVFFKGCMLKCIWCQNPESINAGEETICGEKVGFEISGSELFSEILKDRIFYETSCGGVTFSGGEPALQIDFLKHCLCLCKENGISAAVDTSGYASYNDFESIYDYTDYFLFDLKLADSKYHLKYTGADNELIISNLKRLTEKGNKVIIRLPMIPGITDTKDNIVGIYNILKKIENIKEINILKYNKFAEAKYRMYNIENKYELPSQPSKEQPEEIKKLFRDLNTETKII